MAVTLFDATLGATTLKQCSAADFAPGNNIAPARASADITASAHYVMFGEPRARWTTTDVEGALAAIDPTSGLSVTSSNIILPWRVRSSGGTFVSGANNIRVYGTDGLVIPQSVTVEQDGTAEMNLEAAFLSTDGQASPISYDGSYSVSGPSYNTEFRLGPNSINGSDVTGITGFTVNFGLEIELERLDGDTFAQAVYINAVNPTIDVRFRNQAVFASHGPLFNAMTAAVFSLREKSAGGTVVADTSEAHITFTFADGIVDVQNLSAQGSSTSVPTLRLVGEELTVATDQALSA